MKLRSVGRRRRAVTTALAMLLSVVGGTVASPVSAESACARLGPQDIKAPKDGKELAGRRVIRLSARSEEDAHAFGFRNRAMPAPIAPLGEASSHFLRVQSTSGGRLHVLIQWKETNIFPIDQTDIDLHIYDAKRTHIASSMVYNPAPEPLRTIAEARDMPLGSGTGGPGWEYVSFDAARCAGYLIEAYEWSSEAEQDISLKVWTT